MSDPGTDERPKVCPRQMSTAASTASNRSLSASLSAGWLADCNADSSLTRLEVAAISSKVSIFAMVSASNAPAASTELRSYSGWQWRWKSQLEFETSSAASLRMRDAGWVRAASLASATRCMNEDGVSGEEGHGAKRPANEVGGRGGVKTSGGCPSPPPKQRRHVAAGSPKNLPSLVARRRVRRNSGLAGGNLVEDLRPKVLGAPR
jgi:hypothetical protein